MYPANQSPEKRTLRAIYLLEQGTKSENVASKELYDLISKAGEKGYDMAYPSDDDFELLKRMRYVEECDGFFRLKKVGRMVAKVWRAEKELEDMVNESARELSSAAPKTKWYESMTIFWPFG